MGSTNTTSGTGCSNGINYSYTLHTSSLYGRFECHVHKHFFKSKVKQVLTNPFTIAGTRWQLVMQKNDRSIGLYLKSKNHKSVTVCYMLAVNYRSGSTKIKAYGERRLLEPESVWGFGSVAPISDVTDPNTGRLHKDCIVVMATIGLICPENENLAIVAHGKPMIITWQLRHLEEFGWVGVLSQKIEMTNATWYINMLPYGDGSTDKEAYWDIYLYCITQNPIKAKFRLSLVNRHDEKENLSGEFVYTFDAEHPNYGGSKITKLGVLYDPTFGFISDGWITITAHIWIDGSVEEHPTRKEEIEGKCVVCLVNEQTSGFVHGESSHKCVCADCCKLLHSRGSRCPICNEIVEKTIINYY